MLLACSHLCCAFCVVVSAGRAHGRSDAATHFDSCRCVCLNIAADSINTPKSASRGELHRHYSYSMKLHRAHACTDVVQHAVGAIVRSVTLQAHYSTCVVHSRLHVCTQMDHRHVVTDTSGGSSRTPLHTQHVGYDTCALNIYLHCISCAFSSCA